MTITEVVVNCHRLDDDQERVLCDVFVNGRLHTTTETRLPMEASVADYQLDEAQAWAEKIRDEKVQPPKWRGMLRERKMSLFLSFHEIARRMDMDSVDFATISLWERGINTPTEAQFRRLCEVLGLGDQAINAWVAAGAIGAGKEAEA